MKKFAHFIILLAFSIFFSSCGIGKKLKDFHKPVDLRTEPLDPDEKS